MKYRKKPLDVEAFQYKADGPTPVPDWFCVALRDGVAKWYDDRLVINTLEGQMQVSPNDYIIKGIKGEIYPCKPDIFEARYDEVL